MASPLQDQITIALNVIGRLRPLAIALVGTALVGTMFAGNAVREAVAAYTKAKAVASEGTDKVKLARQSLVAEDYTRNGGVVVSLYPGVRVTVSAAGDAMTLSIQNIAFYDVWLRALLSLQSNAKNVVWEAKSICLQSCAGGSVASAEVQGYVQSVEFEK